jgi:hypothetical protein
MSLLGINYFIGYMQIIFNIWWLSPFLAWTPS